MGKTYEGEVKAISHKNRSVLINANGRETWHKVLDNVKMEYVNKGKCSFKTNTQGDIFYIHTEKNQKKETNNGSRNDELMSRMSALKAAAVLLEGTAKEDLFEERVKKNFKFLSTGNF